MPTEHFRFRQRRASQGGSSAIAAYFDPMKEHAPASDEPLAAPDAPARRASLIERLYVEHNTSLLRFLASKLGSHQEAREIAQEAYVRLLSLDTPGAISYLRAFLYKTASNLATDRLRSRSRRSRLDEWNAARETLDLPPAPDTQLATSQEMERLGAALQELPPKCRRAFLLHKFHGLTMVEVAEHMHVTDRMVRLYVSRALLHCRRALMEPPRRDAEP